MEKFAHDKVHTADASEKLAGQIYHVCPDGTVVTNPADCRPNGKLPIFFPEFALSGDLSPKSTILRAGDMMAKTTGIKNDGDYDKQMSGTTKDSLDAKDRKADRELT